MRRTRWWAQAIGLGMTASIAIWFSSSVVVILGSFLIGWGPVAFFQYVGLSLLSIFLACTAPFWIIGGLLWLVGALRSPDQQERRAANTARGTAEGGGPSASDADGWGKAFRHRWSRRWNSFERGVVDWFVLRPALLEQRFALAGRGNGYLRRYLRGWLLGSISLFGMLTIMGAGARAKIDPGDRSLQGLIVARTLVEFALAVSLCSLLLARYIVTRALVKRMDGMEAGV